MEKTVIIGIIAVFASFYFLRYFFRKDFRKNSSEEFQNHLKDIIECDEYKVKGRFE